MAKQRLAVTTEPSLDRIRIDTYRPYPLIGTHPPDYQAIGGYAVPAIKVRMPANAPGVCAVAERPTKAASRTAGIMARQFRM